MSWKRTVGNENCKQLGELCLVATPIGNLQDITLRALEALKAAHIVVCEDTRVTRVLLGHFGITPPVLWTYHEHNADQQRPKIIEAVKNGAKVALVSDAGTPLISDPGYKLVRAFQEEGLPLTALPGPCAAVMALSLSGLPTDQFFFAGFPPRRSNARQTFFKELLNVPGTLIFYESPKRFIDMLKDMEAVFGERDVAFARELTKRFEEIRKDTIKGFLEMPGLDTLKGELVVLVGPKHHEALKDEDIDTLLATRLETLSLKDAVQEVASRFHLSRQKVYARALALRGDEKA